MKLEDRIVESLETSVTDLDGATRSRLTQARHEALRTRRESRFSRWLPAAALGMAALVVVGLRIDQRQPAAEPNTEIVTVSPQDDLDMLLDDSGDLEMLAELEFYLWLDAQLDDTEISG